MEKDILVEKCASKLGLSKFAKIWPIREPMVVDMSSWRR